MTIGAEAPPIPTASAGWTAQQAVLAPVLRWQEADARRQLLESQLKSIPMELSALERRAAEEIATVEAKRKAVLELEVQRKDLDNRLKTAEAQVLKYRTQQAEVRKNDEYQALSHQITTAETEVDALETEEIAQLLKIDEARAALQDAETVWKSRRADLDGETALVKRREAQLRADLAAQAGAVETAVAGVAPVWRRACEMARSRALRPPFVVPILEHRCGGCHLRVSNEVAEAARHGGKPAHCDNCGRVVYWPA